MYIGRKKYKTSCFCFTLEKPSLVVLITISLCDFFDSGSVSPLATGRQSLGLLCSPLFLQCLEQCLEQSRCSNIGGMNEYANGLITNYLEVLNLMF